jgi:tetratricopeptide (TPR) repeat protein
VLLLTAMLVASLGSPAFVQAEATSLLGKPLIAPAIPPDTRARLEADLAAARAERVKAPDDPDAIIWVGRRTAYLGRYREAVGVFTEGMQRFPADARFLRHRGHRYLTLREFDKAIADLERASTLVTSKPDEVEPDGQPNAQGIPLTTLQSNIRYHLALAYYLKGDFARAAPVWLAARDAVKNPDNLVSATHWLYLTLRRLGRTDEAAAALSPITAGLTVVENSSYHALCLLYKGERQLSDVVKSAGSGASGAAVLYGASAWLHINNRQAEADALWRALVDSPEWAPFGVIAAEAELARRK